MSLQNDEPGRISLSMHGDETDLPYHKQYDKQKNTSNPQKKNS